jgi:tetratricopeptide (TPR) repeat protein
VLPRNIPAEMTILPSKPAIEQRTSGRLVTPKAGVGLFLAAMWFCFSVTGNSQQPNDFAAISAAAAAARNQGDIVQAVQLYRQAVALDPQWPNGWWFLGVLQYGANQFAPARDALTHFIDLKPNGGAAIALRGLCEFETGDFTESLTDIQRGIELGAAAQPRNAEILSYHEALLLTRLGRFDEAIGKYTKFMKFGKINDELRVAIGLAGLRMPLLPKDVDPLKVAQVTLAGSAGADIMSGQMESGQQKFEQLFASYPALPNAHYFYGYLLFTSQSEAAVAQFKQELLLSPENATVQAMLAWAYGLKGDYAAALPFAQKAVGEDPSVPMHQLILGKALMETGETKAGLPHLEKAMQLEPSYLEAHLALAKAYSRLGRKDDAFKERQLSMQLSYGGAAPSATP